MIPKAKPVVVRVKSICGRFSTPFSMSWLRAFAGDLPGDFPAWQTVYTYFRTWRKDETWLQLHDRLRDWTRIEQERHRSPSEAIVDSQSIKSAAMVSQSVSYDAGKHIKDASGF